MPLATVAPVPHAYEIEIDARRATEAKVTLVFATAPSSIYPGRDGDGGGVVDVRCEDGREAVLKDGRWRVPTGCRRLEWTIALDDLDATGIDAGLPSAAYSRRHGFLVLPERDGLLRASNDSGSATVRLIGMDGSVVEREYAFPSINQPPFYAVGRMESIDAAACARAPFGPP
jgi:hypothetical protein